MAKELNLLIALEIERIKSNTQNKKYILTNTMIGESLVTPTILTFSLFELGLYNGNSIAQAMQLLGFPFYHEPSEPAGFALLFGRPYVNVSSYTQASLPNWPLNFSSGRKVGISINPSILWRWPLMIYQSGRILFHLRQFVLSAESKWALMKMKCPDEIKDIEKMSGSAKKIQHSLTGSQKFFAFHVATDFCFGGIQVLLKSFHKILKAPHDINVWDPNFQDMPLIQFHLDLWKLSHDLISKDAFISKHGSRSHKDWEISAARFYEATSELNSLLKSLKEKESFEVVFKNQQIEKAKRQGEIRKYLDDRKSFLKKWYLSLGKSYAKIFVLREDSKRVCFDWIALFRRLVLDVQKENHWGDIVYHLSIKELNEALVETDHIKLASLFQMAQERKETADCLKSVKLPSVVDTSRLEELFKIDSYLKAEELVCLSPGIVEGDVIVVHSASDCSGIQSNHIVVTRFVDPQYIPFMIKARGWILEQGSLLGHSSILAREALIPVISSYRNATELLKQGSRVRLDANAGEVRQV